MVALFCSSRFEMRSITLDGSVLVAGKEEQTLIGLFGDKVDFSFTGEGSEFSRVGQPIEMFFWVG